MFPWFLILLHLYLINTLNYWSQSLIHTLPFYLVRQWLWISIKGQCWPASASTDSIMVLAVKANLKWASIGWDNITMIKMAAITILYKTILLNEMSNGTEPLFVCLFCCLTSQVNSYGHGGTVSSPSHTFSWAGLNKRLTSNSCTYFRL